MTTTLLTSTHNFTYSPTPPACCTVSGEREWSSQMEPVVVQATVTIHWVHIHLLYFAHKLTQEIEHTNLCASNTTIWKILNILQTHKPTISSVYCGRRDTTILLTGTNLRYLAFTENVSSQTAVYVHFSTPITEQSSESYWLECIVTLNLALTDKTSCRL